MRTSTTAAPSLRDDAYRSVFAAMPSPCMLLDRDLVICDANAAFLAMAERDLDQLRGRHLFDAFPSNQGEADGPSALEASMMSALRSGQPHRMPIFQYDVEFPPGSGRYEERWWSTVNVPVCDADGTPCWVLHVPDDVTEIMRERAVSARDRAAVEGLQIRAEALETDLYARSRELAAASAVEARTSRRLAGLAEAALALAGTETVEELTDVIIGRGLVALGADGGAVAVIDDSGAGLHLTMTDSLGGNARRQYAQLSIDDPLPGPVVARTGQTVLLPNREAGIVFAPEMAEVYAATGKEAWAALPLIVGSRRLGALLAGWTEPQEFAADEVELMAAFAAQCAQALDRLLVRQAERQAAAASRKLSETLQRSLLTEPPQPDHLQVVARFVPAAAEAQVGGDWYDAFLVAGTLSLVVGDVAGHDTDAAAAMGQVRGVLRGVAHATGTPPAAVLSALDRALQELGVGVLATAVLAQVHQSEADGARGARTLQWSNAGHPPPLLVHPDGTAELLGRRSDLLLGLDPTTERQDHTAELPPGSTVLFFTDGLVERRGSSLDDGLEWLRDAVAALSQLELNELCDALLAQLDIEQAEDDVALLALRAHPQN